MATIRPISIRLTPEVDTHLRRLAGRTRRPLGQVINELLEQQLRSRRFPGIVFNEGPSGIRASLYGTGLDAWEVVALVRAYRQSGGIDRLLKEHRQLTQRDLDLALDYAAAYPDEIEEAIADNERLIEDVLRDSPHVRAVWVGA